MSHDIRHAGAGRWRLAMWSAAALLLLAPLVAMRFTREANWGPGDFLIFGAMLAAACGAFELAVRVTGRTAWRVAVGVGIAGVFLLVWAELAVGVF